jgi:type I restriction enzyme S subunit
MSKYQAYSEYKDSGVEWLGELPINWTASKIKWVASSVMTGNTPNEDCFEGGFVDWYTPSDFEGDVDLRKASKRINLERLTKEVRFFPNNSILIVGIGATLGKVGLISKTSSSNQQINAIVPDRNVTPRFVAYALTIKTEIMRQLSNASTIGIMNQEKTKQIPISLPTTIEQKKIANFLDHETAKIDTLIEKQQQLIKLLKEKRQAVISDAVTKGLNPDAPMKDSGVEWLGEVPEHWGLVPLKYLCDFKGGGTPSKDNFSYWTDGIIPWVSPKDMKTFWLSETQDKLTPLAVKESSTNFVDKDSLLIVVRSGILQRTIPIAINTVEVTLNQDMKALKFNQQMNVEYAANYILGNTESLLFEWSKEGATVESIEYEYLANSVFPVPPICEQENINALLKQRVDTFQKLEDRAVKGIDLLKERRTALISAAVTGKVDVRDFKAGDTNAA